MKNKFFFTLFSALMLTASLWAQDGTYSPTLEYNLRPKADGSNYDAKKEAKAPNVAFEINHYARFCVVQKYTIANLDAVKKLTLSLRGDNAWGTDALAVWALNGVWTISTSAADFKTIYENTTGVVPGTTGTTTTTYLLRDKSNTKSDVDANNVRTCTFVIEGTALETLKKQASADGTFMLLITNNKDAVSANSNAKRQMYSQGCETETYRSILTVNDYAAITNANSKAVYDNLATAVAAAQANDVLVLNSDVTISGSRVEIKKALTIQGATGAEKLICGVSASTLMILANDNTANYDVTFKNLIVDGQNTSRSTQMFDANNNGRLVFDNVSVINSAYSVATADVKSSNREVVLKGNNSFSTGIYLNSGKRVDGKDATHSKPIRLILEGSYAQDFCIVLNSTNYSQYETVDANGVAFWNLYVSGGKELKGKKSTDAIFDVNSQTYYNDLATAVGTATAGDVLVLNKDVTISDASLAILKALTIQGATGAEKLISDVPADQIMILANDNTAADYEVTFRNLIMDGQDAVRSTQLVDANGKAKLTFENVSIINTAYSVITADVKNNGGNITLKGNNAFAQGIYLNKNKRVDGKEATHTAPIPLVLAGDYVEGYCVVLNCKTPAQYTARDASGVAECTLAVSDNKELVLNRTFAPVRNTTKALSYDNLPDAIAAAADNDVLTLSEDMTLTERLTIAKPLTIYGRTGVEKILRGVELNDLFVLVQKEVTFRNLTFDGQNVERAKDAFEASGNTTFDGVTFQNFLFSGNYSEVKVNAQLTLTNLNIIPNGVILNAGRRIKEAGTTHTEPIQLILNTNYAENYAIVLTCSDNDKYTVRGIDGTPWETYVSNNEIKGRKLTTHTYNLTVSAAEMATLVLGFNVPTLPAGVKAYTLTNDGSAEINATEETSITNNKPVLIIAEAGTYTFESEAGAVLNEQDNPTNGCLIGTYTDNTSVPVANSYILSNGSEGVGFYKVDAGDYIINAHRAYLSSTYVASASAPMRIRFQQQTPTEVGELQGEDEAIKRIENGQLIIRRNGCTYNALGQIIK